MLRDPFPAPLQLGTHTIAWRESDVAAWLDRRAQRAAEVERFVSVGAAELESV
jgi:predicted DNA-binding transcriptional regulator AlpA